MARFAGLIVMWSGSLATIPDGWVLCDGDNDTPDLTDKFVMCADADNPPASSGGNWTHDHTVTTNPHAHSLIPGVNISTGTDYSNRTGEASPSGLAAEESHLPPFYALAYIMKQ